MTYIIFSKTVWTWKTTLTVTVSFLLLSRSWPPPSKLLHTEVQSVTTFHFCWGFHSYFWRSKSMTMIHHNMITNNNEYGQKNLVNTKRNPEISHRTCRPGTTDKSVLIKIKRRFEKNVCSYMWDNFHFYLKRNCLPKDYVRMLHCKYFWNQELR